MTPDQLQSARLLCEQATPECGEDCEHIECSFVVAQEKRTVNLAALVPALLDEVERRQNIYNDLLEAHVALINEANAERDTLMQQVADLEANAVRMREYRFALENIPTDGNGNPLPGDTRNR